MQASNEEKHSERKKELTNLREFDDEKIWKFKCDALRNPDSETMAAKPKGNILVCLGKDKGKKKRGEKKSMIYLEFQRKWILCC